MIRTYKNLRQLVAALLLLGVSQIVNAQDSTPEHNTELIFQLDQEAAADRGLKINSQLLKRVAKQAQVRVDLVLSQEKITSDVVVESERIVVKLPSEVTQAQFTKVKSSLLNSAWVEFALLANEVRHAKLIELSKQPENSKSHRVYRKGQLVGLWCPVALDSREKPKIEPSDQVATREGPNGKKSPLEYLVVVDSVPGLRLTSRYFETVKKQKSEHGLLLSFKLNRQGGTLMKDVTSKNLPVANRPQQAALGIEDGAQEAVPELAGEEAKEEAGYRARLAIIFDGQIHMAPMINGVISTSGVVDGNFTDEELDGLVESLNLAPIEVPLILIEERK
jgi:SecD/SecF fusion protein